MRGFFDLLPNATVTFCRRREETALLLLHEGCRRRRSGERWRVAKHAGTAESCGAPVGAAAAAPAAAEEGAVVGADAGTVLEANAAVLVEAAGAATVVATALRVGGNSDLNCGCVQ